MRAFLLSFCFLGSGLAMAGCAAGDLSLPGDDRAVELRAVSGGGQEGLVRSRLPHPLIVGVRDGSGRPVPDLSLAFRFRDEFPNAAIEPAEVRTDAQGQASVFVRLGSTAGSQTVEATVAEDVAPDARAVFGVTALERRGGGRDGGGEKGKGKNKGKDKKED